MAKHPLKKSSNYITFPLLKSVNNLTYCDIEKNVINKYSRKNKNTLFHIKDFF